MQKERVDERRTPLISSVINVQQPYTYFALTICPSTLSHNSVVKLRGTYSQL